MAGSYSLSFLLNGILSDTSLTLRTKHIIYLLINIIVDIIYMKRDNSVVVETRD